MTSIHELKISISIWSLFFLKHDLETPNPRDHKFFKIKLNHNPRFSHTSFSYTTSLATNTTSKICLPLIMAPYERWTILSNTHNCS